MDRIAVYQCYLHQEQQHDILFVMCYPIHFDNASGPTLEFANSPISLKGVTLHGFLHILALKDIA